MEISAFTFRVILLFLPGFITCRIVDRLTSHKEYKFYQVLLFSLTDGILCYFAYFPFTLIPCLGLKFTFLDNLSNVSNAINTAETLLATGLSLPLGFAIAYIVNREILFRIARKCGISNKFGAPDVWSYILNVGKSADWVVVRDPTNNLMYEGRVQFFSEGSDGYEIFMRDVQVFTHATGEELYKTPALYIYTEKKCFIVEFPKMTYSESIYRVKRKECNDEPKQSNI